MPKKKTTDDDGQYFTELAEAKEETSSEQNNAWLDGEYGGQLAVDVYDSGEEFVVRAAIAGVRADDIDVSVNKDMVTIRGRRPAEEAAMAGTALYEECYWGGFSRTIILPTEVRADQVAASLKNGILKVRLPKFEPPAGSPVAVVDEDVEEEADENEEK